MMKFEVFAVFILFITHDVVNRCNTFTLVQSYNSLAHLAAQTAAVAFPPAAAAAASSPPPPLTAFTSSMIVMIADTLPPTIPNTTHALFTRSQKRALLSLLRLIIGIWG